MPYAYLSHNSDHCECVSSFHVVIPALRLLRQPTLYLPVHAHCVRIMWGTIGLRRPEFSPHVFHTSPTTASVPAHERVHGIICLECLVHRLLYFVPTCVLEMRTKMVIAPHIPCPVPICPTTPTTTSVSVHVLVSSAYCCISASSCALAYTVLACTYTENAFYGAPWLILACTMRT